MEAVHVLGGIDSQQHACFVDLKGQRELHQDPVDLGVRIEALHQTEQLRFGGVGRERELARVEAQLASVPVLHADVDLARRILPDQDRGQPGHHAALGAEPLDSDLHLRPDLARDRVAVDELDGHSRPISRSPRLASRAPRPP